jgi:signal transduction histidine kinase/HAMP domain-containing protein
MTIRNKFLLTVLPAALTVLACLTYLSYATSRKALMREIEGRARVTLEAGVLRLDGVLARIEDALQDLRVSLEVLGPESDEEVKGLIRGFLRWNPEVYGSAIAFRPGASPSGSGLFAPYYCRDEAGLRYLDLASPSYHYPDWDWYRQPAGTGKLVWGPPYLDTGGGDVTMITCSCPFLRDKEFWGVVTADVSLSGLTDIVRNIVIGKSGYAFLMTGEGVMLSGGEGLWDPGEDIYTLAGRMHSPELEALGRDMSAGRSGFFSLREPITGKRAWVVYGPVPSTGWSLGILFPEEELTADLRWLHRSMILIALSGVIVLAGILFFLSTRISRPMSELAASARRIAGGDFSERLLDPGTRDEVGTLTDAFNEMHRSLSVLMERLHGEKEMFRIAFSQMPAGVVILDGAWNTLQCNRAAETLLRLDPGRSLLENLRTRFEFVNTSEDLEAADEEPATFELRRKEDRDAADLVLACILTPVRDGNGRLRERILTVRDITEQASEEHFKRNFLSLISHKLLTPLTVMQCGVNLMQDGLLGDLNSEQRENADTLGEQFRKMQTLIEKLVSFVALEGGSLDRSVETIHLPALVSELAGDLAVRFPEKRTVVVMDPSSGGTTISFNRKYLALMLGQLLENGLKFNHSDPARVTVSCREEDLNAVITVADNGTGIPPEYTGRIFEKFFQIEKYFTGNVEGAGLGLAYVKKIVETFGGQIEVATEPGKGSSFTVRLPRNVPPR